MLGEPEYLSFPFRVALWKREAKQEVPIRSHLRT
jgi:hypothetical protein